MRVSLEIITGAYIDTDVNENATVKDLKEKIAAEHSLPLSRLILLIGDEEMRRVVSDYEDESLLVDLGVSDGSHMYMFFKHLDLLSLEERGRGGGGEFVSMEDVFSGIERKWECEVKTIQRQDGREEMEVEEGRKDAEKKDEMEVDTEQDDEEAKNEEEDKEEEDTRGKEKEEEEVRGVEVEEEEAKGEKEEEENAEKEEEARDEEDAKNEQEQENDETRDKAVDEDAEKEEDNGGGGDEVEEEVRDDEDEKEEKKGEDGLEEEEETH